jgi:pilus assembly protein Flp/PilA
MKTLIQRFMRARPVTRFRRDERGATAIEYGLIVSLIFLAATAAIKGYASKTNVMYSNISSNLSNP